MIEAIEVHETCITKPVFVELKHPFQVGVWLGIGFIFAPVILVVVFSIILGLLSLIGVA